MIIHAYGNVKCERQEAPLTAGKWEKLTEEKRQGVSSFKAASFTKAAKAAKAELEDGAE